MALTLRQAYRLFTRAFSSSKHRNLQITVNDKRPNVLQLVVADKSKDQNEKIAAFVTDNFARLEPVTLAAELDCTEELRRYVLRNVEEGKSLLVVNPSNQEILAAAVNMDTRPNSFQLAKEYALTSTHNTLTKSIPVVQSSTKYECKRHRIRGQKHERQNPKGQGPEGRNHTTQKPARQISKKKNRKQNHRRQAVKKHNAKEYNITKEKPKTGNLTRMNRKRQESTRNTLKRGKLIKRNAKSQIKRNPSQKEPKI